MYHMVEILLIHGGFEQLSAWLDFRCLTEVTHHWLHTHCLFLRVLLYSAVFFQNS
jgi:hypothetical protein